MSDREAFEQWLLDEQGLVGSWDYERGCYSEFPAHLAYKAWQAAREQEGGEVVAYVDPRALDNFASGSATKEWLWAAPDAGLIPVYTHPPQSQGVPEGFCLDGGHRTLKANTGKDCSCPKYIRHPHCDRYETRGCLPTENPWFSTPAAPQADNWIKCSDRLPREADGDFTGNVIWWGNIYNDLRPSGWCAAVNHWNPHAWECAYFENLPDELYPHTTHWKPTGLKRPQPPEQGDGV
jgi:hypothetical protein